MPGMNIGKITLSKKKGVKISIEILTPSPED